MGAHVFSLWKPKKKHSLMHRRLSRAVLLMLAYLVVITLPQATSLHPRNDTCAHSGGVCGEQVGPTRQRRTDSAARQWMDTDDELMGQMEKNMDSFAMRPAAFPKYLPANVVASTVTNLPQPRLTRSQADAAPPWRVFVMGGVMDPSIALGLY